MHLLTELKPNVILEVLDALDAYRRPYQFEQYLLASEADFRGRPGYENVSMPNMKLFKRCYQVSKAVDTQPILEAGFEGKAISQELTRQRTNAIAKLLKNV